MSSDRPRLFIPAPALLAERQLVDSLRSVFEVIEVESEAEARDRTAKAGSTWLLMPSATDADRGGNSGVPPDELAATLEHIGEGVGVIDADGTLGWANSRLREYDPEIMKRFIETCRHAMRQFDQAGAAAVPLIARPGQKFSYAVGDHHFEVLVSIASIEESRERTVRTVVGIISDVTAGRQLQDRIDAIDAAGAELMRIDAAAIANLNMAERLTLLEEKIIRYVRELLHFDKFEVRLTDRETNQLELVFNRGLTPLKIGEVIYAEIENNGICGYVATTGEPYVCNVISKDELYKEGLEGASSSLTVPLRLYDQILGVFNVESTAEQAFDDNDRRFAQIFARHIAMAMHILDLLVIERCTTNEQVAANVLSELREPLDEITAEATRLRVEAPADDANRALAEGLDRIAESTEGIRRRLAVCTSGPKSILGAEQEMQRDDPLPAMVGKRILLADNEARVRDDISALLRQKGADVLTCSGGAETIELLRRPEAKTAPYDLVISDIRMPDRNGYEVFRTAKECCPETPVILITGFGYDPHHSIVRANQEGLHSFLFKPLRAKQLLEAVTKAFVR